MMLREVLLKEDLHHMMSIDDGNFPGDDIIPMSQLFTDEKEEEEQKQERNPTTRKPGRVRLPGLRFPPAPAPEGKKKNVTKKANNNNNGKNKKMKTRGVLSPPSRPTTASPKKSAGPPSFNSLFKRQKAKRAKVKATEESIEKIIELVATDDGGGESPKVEDVTTEKSETSKRGEKLGSEGNESKFPGGESDFGVTRITDNEYEVKMSDSLKPSDNRRNEYLPPPPYPPSRLPSSDEPVTLPNLFDADWLLQVEQAVGETAAHLTPDPMSYLRSVSIFEFSDGFL